MIKAWRNGLRMLCFLRPAGGAWREAKEVVKDVTDFCRELYRHREPRFPELTTPAVLLGALWVTCLAFTTILFAHLQTRKWAQRGSRTC